MALHYLCSVGQGSARSARTESRLERAPCPVLEDGRLQEVYGGIRGGLVRLVELRNRPRRESSRRLLHRVDAWRKRTWQSCRLFCTGERGPSHNSRPQGQPPPVIRPSSSASAGSDSSRARCKSAVSSVASFCSRARRRRTAGGRNNPNPPRLGVRSLFGGGKKNRELERVMVAYFHVRRTSGAMFGIHEKDILLSTPARPRRLARQALGLTSDPAHPGPLATDTVTPMLGVKSARLWRCVSTLEFRCTSRR